MVCVANRLEAADGWADDVSHYAISGKLLRLNSVLKLFVSNLFVYIVYNICVLCNVAGGKAWISHIYS